MNTIRANVKQILFALLTSTHILLAVSISQAQPYQTISTQNSIVGGDLSRTVTLVQSGNNTIDRFQMTSVKKADVPNNGLKGVVLLLPPLGSGFQNYEVSDNGDYNNSFVAFFARRNFAVVGYSPRQHSLTAGSCESGAIDCSPMQNWGLATINGDVAYIRQQIGADYPDLKVVIGGLSMGTKLARNARPARVSNANVSFVILITFSFRGR